MGVLYLTQNNTKPSVNFTVTDSTGAAVNLTGSTVSFHLFPIGGSVAIVTGACTITNPTQGLCNYAWATNDLQTPGAFHGSLHIIFPDSSNQDTNLMGFDVRPIA